MDYEEVGDLDGVPFRVPTTDDYRACTVCGDDCEADVTLGSDKYEARIAFIWPERGVNTIFDLFEGQCYESSAALGRGQVNKRDALQKCLELEA